MLNAFKARLRASTATLATPRQERELIRDFTRMVARLVMPGSIGAGYVNCPCTSFRHLNGNCPYHGRAAGRIVHG